MSGDTHRIDHDSMGPVAVPAAALWGAQTQRAVDNFRLSDLVMPARFIHALGLVKAVAAEANAATGGLVPPVADAIVAAALEVADGQHDGQFPVDVFQTGSGTSSNMNANEVVATLAARRLGQPVHPNDHVNMSQSSNDVVPTALHVAAVLGLRERLVPGLERLRDAIAQRILDTGHVVKTGRTHLMDAVPVTFGQVLGAWRQQVDNGIARVKGVAPRLHCLALGGTAVGTGLNAPPGFAAFAVRRLAERTGVPFVVAPDAFEALSTQDAAVELSGQLKVVAVGVAKIANDLRWMNSGPLAGLGEISLPALQPGSSIMPGKVNPVVPEAVAMVTARVIGNDATVTVAGQSGNFELNVMWPVVASTLLQSIDLLGSAAAALADQAIAGFTVNTERLQAVLARNPILVTALNRRIGYERGAAIAKRAYREGRAIRDVAREMTDLSQAELDALLDPAVLARGGTP